MGGQKMSVMAQQLNDPEGWGHPSMDVYDKEYEHLFDNDNGKINRGDTVVARFSERGKFTVHLLWAVQCNRNNSRLVL